MNDIKKFNQLVTESGRLELDRPNIVEKKVRIINCPWCGECEWDIQTQTEDREGIPTNLICCVCGATSPWAYLDSIPDDVNQTAVLLQSKMHANLLKYIHE